MVFKVKSMALTGTLLAIVPELAAAASIEAGRSLAVMGCAACHQVTPGQKRPAPVAEGEEGPHVQAPTFAQIAARCQPAAQLRAEVANPHYPMREQLFQPMDLDDITAYIGSLAPGKACPTP